MALKWQPMYNYYLTLKKHPDGEFPSCAIRLSMCLRQFGVFDKVGYKKAGKKVSAHGWAMVAEQLYQWLRCKELGEAKQIPITQADWSNLPQQNGIVYLRNCYPRTTTESIEARTGDHIDLYVGGQGLFSAIRWPNEFPDGPMGLMSTCRDGKARFWPLS
jgi:hypothetical protein